MSHKIYAWGKTFSFSLHIGTSHSCCFSNGKRARLLLEGFCLGQGQVKIFQPNRLTTNSALDHKLETKFTVPLSYFSTILFATPERGLLFYSTRHRAPLVKKLKKQVERLVLTGFDNKLISLLTSRR